MFALIVQPVRFGRRGRAAMFLHLRFGLHLRAAKAVAANGGICGAGRPADALLKQSRDLDAVLGCFSSRVERMEKIK